MDNKKVFLRISCSERLTATAISNSEHIFAAGSASGFIYLWHTFSGNLLKKIRAHQRKISCLLFSPEGGLLITAAEDGISQVYMVAGLIAPNAHFKVDLNNGNSECKAKYTFIGHSEKINCMVLGKGNVGRLYTGSSDKTIIGFFLFFFLMIFY